MKSFSLMVRQTPSPRGSATDVDTVPGDTSRVRKGFPAPGLAETPLSAGQWQARQRGWAWIWGEPGLGNIDMQKLERLLAGWPPGRVASSDMVFWDGPGRPGGVSLTPGPQRTPHKQRAPMFF